MDDDRRIIHLDLDCFYAQVEQRDHADYRGRPVIVGGDPSGRGVVATASYEARPFGVHSAQSCRKAMQLCPQAIMVRPRFEVYRAVSHQIFAIYKQVTPLVEPLALDEAYLDVTAVVAEGGSATALARQIKQEIYAQTHLTASAGVSYCKSIAKLASGYHKPNGLTVVPPQAAPAFLAHLPVSAFFGVGDVTAARLRELGVKTGGDLMQVPLERLHALFGKRGLVLYQQAHGQDDRAVEPERQRKSVGKETTLAYDITDRAQMLRILETLAIEVAQRLTALELAGTTLTLKLRWHDFQHVTRSLSVPVPLQDAPTMLRWIPSLLDPLLSAQKPVRLLGITISSLVPDQAHLGVIPGATRSLWEWKQQNEDQDDQDERREE